MTLLWLHHLPAIWSWRYIPWEPLTHWSRDKNDRHFSDDVFKCILLNDNARISLKISPRLVSKVRINNIPALVQIMALRRPGDKPLSEPMMDNLLTHIYVTWPQWVNSLRPIPNRRHFAYDIFKCISENENWWIPIKISLKFVLNGPINYNPALVQVKA